MKTITIFIIALFLLSGKLNAQGNSILLLPNIFTPNSDGTNDEFKPEAQNIQTLNCKLYNRWGIQVAELTQPNQSWDGRTTSGIECEAGVYYCILTATGNDDKEYEQKSFVQLVR